MSRYWSTLVKQLTPYVPGEQPRHPNLVKLNTNENPYPPSPKVLEALSSVDGDALRRYPDPESNELRHRLACYFDLRPDQVFLGNGSDEVLALAFQALLKQELPLLFPDITYSFYPVWCELYGVQYRQVPLDADFQVDVGDYQIESGGILIPNPNAPTGVLLGLEDIRQLLLNNRDSVVVVDEAYIDFGGQSAVSLISDFDNLLVVQTVSKSRSLAGLRVGVALGHADLIEGLDRVKNSFNSYPMDVVAQQVTLASLDDEQYFQRSCDKVVASRQRLTQALQQMGFAVLPSAANFVFVSPPGGDAASLFAALRERGVIVRYFNKPRIDQFLRITIGTDEQCDALLAALQELL